MLLVHLRPHIHTSMTTTQRLEFERSSHARIRPSPQAKATHVRRHYGDENKTSHHNAQRAPPLPTHTRYNTTRHDTTATSRSTSLRDTQGNLLFAEPRTEGEERDGTTIHHLRIPCPLFSSPPAPLPNPSILLSPSPFPLSQLRSPRPSRHSLHFIMSAPSLCTDRQLRTQTDTTKTPHPAHSDASSPECFCFLLLFKVGYAFWALDDCGRGGERRGVI
ncbi:hypothetical protein IWZ01DRAFT_507613 [Phyllosticta capitalensis]